MEEYLSETIYKLVDRIDSLIILRAERNMYADSAKAADDFRVALADTLCDFVMAIKDELIRGVNIE